MDDSTASGFSAGGQTSTQRPRIVVSHSARPPIILFLLRAQLYYRFCSNLNSHTSNKTCTSGSQREFRVVGSVARASEASREWVSRPCNMSVGVPNVHVKVYNMLIPHNNPNVCACMFEVLTTPVLYVNIAKTTMLTCNTKHVDMAILDMCICKHFACQHTKHFHVGMPCQHA